MAVAVPSSTSSSIYGIIGSPTSAAYHAAKSAIRTFTKAAAVQQATEPIRVNSVHPGYAVTPLPFDRSDIPTPRALRHLFSWLTD